MNSMDFIMDWDNLKFVKLGWDMVVCFRLIYDTAQLPKKYEAFFIRGQK